MPLRFIATLASTVLIAGCASTVSVSDLRNTNEGSTTIVASLPYDAAYRIIVAEARRCYERTMPGATVNVRGDLYSESRTAEVSVAAALSSSNIAEIVIDIRATGQTASEIKAIYRKKSSESVANAMRAWLGGDKTTCQ